MRKNQIKIGAAYVCKVSNGLTVVRIESECFYGGWWAVNVRSGRRVRIRTAARLRAPGGEILRRLGETDLARAAADREPDGKEERNEAQ